MNTSMILALVGLWVSGFVFGVVFSKIRNGKRMKMIMQVHIDKDQLHQIVKKQADEIRKECVLIEDVETVFFQMRDTVINMKSDRMSGDCDLIRRAEVIYMINQNVKDLIQRKHWGDEND